MADVAPGLGILAGRDRELSLLRRWLAEAVAGHGRLVVLTGPPGIGKTRLAEEVAGGARGAGQRVLRGRAVEDEGAPPLWPWRRILAAVGGAGERDGLTGDPGGARSDDLAAARFRAAAAAADSLATAQYRAGSSPRACSTRSPPPWPPNVPAGPISWPRRRWWSAASGTPRWR